MGEPQYLQLVRVLKAGDFKDATTTPLVKHVKLMADKPCSGQGFTTTHEDLHDIRPVKAQFSACCDVRPPYSLVVFNQNSDR